MSEFKGKTVLVTGGNRGLGLAISRAFAESGATVFVAGRDRDACEGAAASIRERGAIAYGLGIDVADYGSTEAALREIERSFGGVDIVINNAALAGPLARLENADPDAWRRSLETNVIGPFNVARAALRLLLARQGTIVNVSAGAADAPFEGMSAYCCSKAALAMLTRSLALEYGAQGLRVFGFRPGMLDTDMQTQIRESRVNKISDVAREALNSPDVAARALLVLSGDKGAVLSGSEVGWNDPRLSV